MKLLQFLLLPFFVRASSYNVAIRNQKKQICRGVLVSDNTVLSLSSCVAQDGLVLVNSEQKESNALEIERHPSKDLALIRTEFPGKHPSIVVADQEFPYAAVGQKVEVEYRGKRARTTRTKEIWACGKDLLCLYRRNKYRRSCNHLRGAPLFLQVSKMNVTSGIMSRGCINRGWKSVFIPIIDEKPWIQDFVKRKLKKSPDVCK